MECHMCQRKEKEEEEKKKKNNKVFFMLFTGVFDQMCESNFQAELFINDFLKFST
jgi:hypothetical protein